MADITMPQLGETVTEGTITRWMKQVGDTVAEDEVLFEVSTDKVDSEVPSPVAGVLTEILVPEGDTVDVGTRLAVISDGDQASPPAPADRAGSRAGRRQPSAEPEADAEAGGPKPSRRAEPEAEAEPKPAGRSGQSQSAARSRSRQPVVAAPQPETWRGGAAAGCSPRWCAA